MLRIPLWVVETESIPSWDDKVKNPTTPMPLRTQQLEIRYFEVLESLKAFKSLIQGNKEALSNPKEYSQWDDWKDQVDTSTVIFVGHSFGGCTGVSVICYYVTRTHKLSDTPLNLSTTLGI